MDRNDMLYMARLLLRDHKCAAMLMALRAGMAAIEALGVERAKEGEVVAPVKIGRDHCATAHADACAANA